MENFREKKDFSNKEFLKNFHSLLFLKVGYRIIVADENRFYYLFAINIQSCRYSFINFTDFIRPVK